MSSSDKYFTVTLKSPHILTLLPYFNSTIMGGVQSETSTHSKVPSSSSMVLSSATFSVPPCPSPVELELCISFNLDLGFEIFRVPNLSWNSVGYLSNTNCK